MAAAGALLHMHAHRCRKCGTVWRHRGDDFFGDAAAHMCPRCGAGPEYFHAGHPITRLLPYVGAALALAGIVLLLQSE